MKMTNVTFFLGDFSDWVKGNSYVYFQPTTHSDEKWPSRDGSCASWSWLWEDWWVCEIIWSNVTCPLNQNDVFRIGQRVRPLFLNSGHLIGSGDMCPQINPFTFWYFWQQNGSKWAKNGHKMSLFGLVWFGLGSLLFWVMSEPKTVFKMVQNS